MVTASAYGGYTLWLLREELKADLSMAAGFFRSQREGMEWWTVPLLSPRLRITWTKERIGETSISLGYYEQFLHQVGFSELGLASDFTVGASPQAPLQKSFAIDISWRRRLPWWGLTLSASAYWSRVRNQTEYQGQVLEVVDEQYDPFLHIVVSDGHNEGLNLALSREFGSINGEISWGYGGGRRHLPEANDESWNALHAPGHSLKGSLSWNPGKHWILSAVYNYSSGRVYTPVESLYLVGGNIAMEYGKRNSARLPYYSRLDLGATYTFQTSIKGTKLSHLVNISILNALGRRNVEMQYFVLNVDKGTYGLKRLYSLYRFIPSISYTLEFR